VKLTCGAGGGCKGTLELLTKAATGSRLFAAPRPSLIGKAAFSLAAGKKATVVVPLKAKGKSLLRSAPARRMKAELTGTGVKARPILLKQKG
jgi:hypothetical protein